jgi:hypothetical protein
MNTPLVKRIDRTLQINQKENTNMEEIKNYVTEFVGDIWIRYPEGDLTARLEAIKQALEERNN